MCIRFTGGGRLCDGDGDGCDGGGGQPSTDACIIFYQFNLIVD